MRKSRVLLAGVAVAAAAAGTSAFTAGNTLNPADDVAGYGELTVTGVAVSNIAYHPLASDAAKLDNVVFTVGEDAADMTALLTISGTGGVLGGGAQTCASSTGGSAPFTITCDGADVLISAISKVGLTVVSK